MKKLYIVWALLLAAGIIGWLFVSSGVTRVGQLHAQARSLHTHLTETLSPQDMARLEEAIAAAEHRRNEWLAPEIPSDWADDAVASASALDALRREALEHEVRLNLAGGLGLAPRPLARIDALRGTLRRIISSGVTAVHDVAQHPQGTAPTGWHTLRIRIQGDSAALGRLVQALGSPSSPGVITGIQVQALPTPSGVGSTSLEIILLVDLPLPQQRAQP